MARLTQIGERFRFLNDLEALSIRNPFGGDTCFDAPADYYARLYRKELQGERIKISRGAVLTVFREPYLAMDGWSVLAVETIGHPDKMIQFFQKDPKYPKDHHIEVEQTGEVDPSALVHPAWRPVYQFLQSTGFIGEFARLRGLKRTLEQGYAIDPNDFYIRLMEDAPREELLKTFPPQADYPPQK